MQTWQQGIEDGIAHTCIIRPACKKHRAGTEKQERRPLLSINDHFRKIVIVGDDIHRKEDELGVLTVGLLDFLTDKNLLEQG